MEGGSEGLYGEVGTGFLVFALFAWGLHQGHVPRL